MDYSQLAIYSVGALVILLILWKAMSSSPEQKKSKLEAELKDVLSDGSTTASEVSAEPASTVTEQTASAEVTAQTEPPQEMTTETASSEKVMDEITSAGQDAVESARQNPEDSTAPEALVDDSQWQALVKSTFKQRVKQTRASDNPNSLYNGGLLVLNVLAEAGKVFNGMDILSVCAAQRLGLNRMGVFHSLDEEGQVLFTVASAAHPGVFDFECPDDFTTKGLSCYIELDQVSQPKLAFRKLLACAHELQYALGGQLIDETGSSLTQESVSAYLSRINTYIDETTLEPMDV